MDLLGKTPLAGSIDRLDLLGLRQKLQSLIRAVMLAARQ
jgi:hypothetical protein